MNEFIDIEKLREYLINYYGTATNVFPAAVLDVIKIENASEEELIKIALKNNIDLNNFIKGNNLKR